MHSLNGLPFSKGISEDFTSNLHSPQLRLFITTQLPKYTRKWKAMSEFSSFPVWRSTCSYGFMLKLMMGFPWMVTEEPVDKDRRCWYGTCSSDIVVSSLGSLSKLCLAKGQDPLSVTSAEGQFQFRLNKIRLSGIIACSVSRSATTEHALCLRPSRRHVMPRPPHMRISTAGGGCFRAQGAGAAAE